MMCFLIKAKRDMTPIPITITRDRGKLVTLGMDPDRTPYL